VILTPTVLVLGAGASKPYGYPLGDELVTRIIGLVSPNGAVPRVMEEDTGVFHDRLRDSGVASIDDFLESNPNFSHLGKIAIAAGITFFGPGIDQPDDPPDGWYKYLWNRLHEGAATSEEFRANQLKIITYNYDTSFERYFARVLWNMYPDLSEKDQSAAAELLSEVMPIVHIHGTVGRYDGDARVWGKQSRFLVPEVFRDAASGIRIVHDDESPEYQNAHQWLREAKRVYVLGFGYHPTNVRRLDLASQWRQSNGGWKDSGGTAYGLQPAEMERINAALNLGDFLRTFDCLTYLRARAHLD
jgi:hypothetical protein